MILPNDPDPGYRRVCCWCDPHHDLGPAPEGTGGDTHTMCDAAKKRMLDQLAETPTALCLHGRGKDEWCTDCEASNNESRSIG